MSGSAAASRQRPDRDVVRAAGRRRDPPGRRAARPAGAERRGRLQRPVGRAARPLRRHGAPARAERQRLRRHASSASGPGPSPTPTCARSRTSSPGRTSCAGFDTEPDGSDGGVPRWPVSEDVDPEDGDPEDRTAGERRPQPLGPTIGFEALRASTPDLSRRTPGRRRRRPRRPLPAAAPAAAARDRPGRAVRLGRRAWAVRPSWCWPRCSACSSRGGSGCSPLVGFMAGFVTLVARMKDRPPNDSGPDDGAVV